MSVRDIVLASNTSSTTTGDPNWANVSLLLSGETTDVDANWSNVIALLPGNNFSDYSKFHNTVTVTGSNITTSTSIKKYGTGSISVTGSNSSNFITVGGDAANLGSGAFTIEFWIYPTTVQSTLVMGSNTTGANAWMLEIGEGNAGGVNFGISASSWPVYGGAVSANVWNHVAVVRDGSNSVKVYINGVGNTGTSVTNTFSNASTLDIGRRQGNYYGGGNAYYLSDLRITSDTARYTANFTPPTAPLPVLSFTDSSVTNATITTYGDTQYSTAVKKYGSSSIKFDGTGDYLETSSSTLASFGTGDFTIEMWVYWVSMSSQTALVVGRDIGWVLYMYPSGQLIWGTLSPITPTNILYGTTVLSVNTWYHIAVTRRSNTFTLWINGVSDTAGTASDTNNYSSAGKFQAGISHVNAYFNGYLDEIRVTKGVARYTANFTPPTSAFLTNIGSDVPEAPATPSTPSQPVDSYTKLLLNGDGTNGSTVFQDFSYSPNTLTVYGNTQVSTTQKKFGTGSIYFDGTGDYIGVPVIACTGDYTVEAWLLRTASVSGFMMLTGYNTTTSWIGWINNNTSIYVGSTSTYVTFTVPDTLNTWAHYAIVRSGGTVNVYVNGVVSTSGGQTLSSELDINLIGAFGSSYTFTGYMDDIRVSTVARYTSNFTPPTSSFSTAVNSGGSNPSSPSWSSVKLLLNGNGTHGSQTFTDLSSAANTLTAYGDARISTAIYKFGTGCMYFDGAGDYITVPTTTNLIFDADFTIECWVYRVAAVYNYDAIYAATANGGWNSSGVDVALSWSCGGFHGFGQQWTLYSSGTSVPTGSWVHMAVTKASGTVRFFIGGTQVHTLTHSGNIGYAGQTQAIGTLDSAESAGRLFFNGYIDDFCITKGIAKYTANYTPPTTALPTS